MKKTTAVAQRDSVLDQLSVRYGMETGELRTVLLDTIFQVPAKEKPFTQSEATAGLILAAQYDLDLFAKELYITKSGGRLMVVIGVDGWIKQCNQHPQFDGDELTFTHDEHGALISATCTIHRKDRQYPTIRTEYLDECRRAGDNWKTKPRRMLGHKAYIQTARAAFGLKGIDEDDLERMREVEDAEVVGIRDDAAVRQPARRKRQPAQLVAPPAEEFPAHDEKPQEETIDPPEEKTVEAEISEPKSGLVEPQAGTSEEAAKNSLLTEWAGFAGKMNVKQKASCREASGAEVICRDLSVDQLQVAVDTAKAVLGV